MWNHSAVQGQQQQQQGEKGDDCYKRKKKRVQATRRRHPCVIKKIKIFKNKNKNKINTNTSRSNLVDPVILELLERLPLFQAMFEVARCQVVLQKKKYVMPCHAMPQRGRFIRFMRQD